MWSAAQKSKLFDSRRRAGCQSGQSLLEIALMLPFLLLLLLGAIDLGRYAYTAILVGNAAHAGALYGAQGLAFSVNTAGIQTAVNNDYQNNDQSVTSLTVNSSTSCACDTGGTISLATNSCSTTANPNVPSSIATCNNGGGHWVVMVSVTASGTFNTLFNYPGIPSTLTISRTSTIRVAQN